ncbi:protein kinase domain-containing protein [Legionella drozanskii]|uniref:protein kinase domain-containing protein n=1 Tax=Legionella drozanskii TaxID=96228 RepID=UPI00138ED9D2|nr:AarF/UbiB family protein [Legionella drozanskii]
MYKGKKFTYNQQEYQLGETIFARERKKGNGYAYEMVSAIRLGSGAYGYVMKISCTISQGKENSAFQALDKDRVVKFERTKDAAKEYSVGQYAEHMHMKKPVGGRLVMRNLGDQTFSRFIRKNLPADCQKMLALTNELIRAYKEQLLEQKLVHRDLHDNNILIKLNPKQTGKPFELNIVDFGLAQYIPKGNEKEMTFFTDFCNQIIPLIRMLWDIPDAPRSVRRFLAKPHSFLDYTNFFENLLLAPAAHTQKSLDDLLDFFERLAKNQGDLSAELSGKVSEAVKASTANNMQPLRDLVLECRRCLKEQNIEKPNFPIVIFDENEKRQRLYYQIEQYYNDLENKGRSLCKTPQQKEGQELCKLVNHLRTKTLDAIYNDDASIQVQLLDCRDFCKELLNDNKELLDIRRDNNYIWGEVAVVLTSLIVLYPVVLGVNYLCTGKIGFFSETNSAKGADKLNRDFAALQTTFVC